MSHETNVGNTGNPRNKCCWIDQSWRAGDACGADAVVIGTLAGTPVCIGFCEKHQDVDLSQFVFASMTAIARDSGARELGGEQAFGLGDMVSVRPEESPTDAIERQSQDITRQSIRNLEAEIKRLSDKNDDLIAKLQTAEDIDGEQCRMIGRIKKEIRRLRKHIGIPEGKSLDEMEADRFRAEIAKPFDGQASTIQHGSGAWVGFGLPDEMSEQEIAHAQSIVAAATEALDERGKANYDKAIASAAEATPMVYNTPQGTECPHCQSTGEHHRRLCPEFSASPRPLSPDANCCCTEDFDLAIRCDCERCKKWRKDQGIPELEAMVEAMKKSGAIKPGEQVLHVKPIVHEPTPFEKAGNPYQSPQANKALRRHKAEDRPSAYNICCLGSMQMAENLGFDVHCGECQGKHSPTELAENTADPKQEAEPQTDSLGRPWDGKMAICAGCKKEFKTDKLHKIKAVEMQFYYLCDDCDERLKGTEPMGINEVFSKVPG